MGAQPRPLRAQPGHSLRHKTHKTQSRFLRFAPNFQVNPLWPPPEMAREHDAQPSPGALGPQRLRGRSGHAPGERREGSLGTGFLSMPGMKPIRASHNRGGGGERTEGRTSGGRERERERKGRQVGVGRGRETMTEAVSPERWAAVHPGCCLHLRSLEEPRKEGRPAQLTTAAERGRPLLSAGGYTRSALCPLGLLASPCGGQAPVPQQSH